MFHLSRENDEGVSTQGAQGAAFLCRLVEPAGRMAVAAIVPDGRLQGRTFELPREQCALGEWIASREGKENLHFNLNEPAPQEQQHGGAGKLAKGDVDTLRGVYLDIDPKGGPDEFEAERKRLLAVADELDALGKSAPAIIVDSGSGIQAFWLFEQPLSASPATLAQVEAQGKALAKRFGGDAVQNVDRLMRIPFTSNLPNAAKRNKGRVAVCARVLSEDLTRRTTLGALAQLAPPEAPTVKGDQVEDAPDLTGLESVIHTPEHLQPELNARLTALLQSEGTVKLTDAASSAELGTRSDADFALACRFAECGIQDHADLAFALAA